MEILKQIGFILIFITIIVFMIAIYEKIEDFLKTKIFTFKINIKKIWNDSPFLRLILIIPTGVIEYFFIYYFILPANTLSLKISDITIGDLARIIISIILLLIISIYQIRLAFDNKFRKKILSD